MYKIYIFVHYNEHMKKKEWHSILNSQAEISLKEMGGLLSQARKRRGLSVTDLAKRVAVDRRTIAQLEKGHAGVSVGVFFQVLSVFNLLRGFNEVLKPENDIEALKVQIQQLRKGKSTKKKISKEEVDF